MVMGRGAVGFETQRSDGSLGYDWVESERIAVSPYGVVLFRTEDGITHVEYGVKAEIHEAEYSVLNPGMLDFDGAGPPKCLRCGDDPSRMPLGRCPSCGKGTQ